MHTVACNCGVCTCTSEYSWHMKDACHELTLDLFTTRMVYRCSNYSYRQWQWNASVLQLISFFICCNYSILSFTKCVGASLLINTWKHTIETRVKLYTHSLNYTELRHPLKVSRKLKHFNYWSELISLEGLLKGRGFTKYARISLCHEWISGTVQTIFNFEK